MAKPQGTYLRVGAQDKIRAEARAAKEDVATARSAEATQTYKNLLKLSERDLREWHRDVASLVKAIKAKEPLNESDKRRKRVSELVGQLRKSLEKAQDLKKIDASLGKLGPPVFKAPSHVVSDPTLPFVILLLQFIEALVRWRRRNR